MHLLINFCLITFICYAVAYPVRVILFGGRRKQQRTVRRRRAVRRPAAVKPKRKAVIIPFRREHAA
ncbi:MAG: hypothetical protein IIV05_05805 [Ruminococcus sp.]|nr:hypothetical protein [Ruminococcus sp.]MBQ5641304.1 hypothetical protein [Ruminococcus sp.]